MFRRVGIFFLASALWGCGINTTAIKNVPVAPLADGQSVIIGKIRYVVDGQELAYHFLNRPALYLAREDLRQYFATPEADADGGFAWSIQPGDYEIAVIFGGMPPIASPWIRKDRRYDQAVNGITNPGIRITVEEKRVQYIGTIQIEVESRSPRRTLKLFGERVFGALNNIVVLDEYAVDARVMEFNNIADVDKRIARLRRAQ
jgi:hypothetical protein